MKNRIMWGVHISKYVDNPLNYKNSKHVHNKINV